MQLCSWSRPHVDQMSHNSLLPPQKALSHGSVDFPVGRDTSSLLGQTNNRLSLHCVCVCVVNDYVWFSAFYCLSVYIFQNEWNHTTNYKSIHACVHKYANARVNCCARGRMWAHVCRCSGLIIVFLSVGLCALRSPLLAAVHEENCWRFLGFPHSQPEYKTLTHSVLQLPGALLTSLSVLHLSYTYIPISITCNTTCIHQVSVWKDTGCQTMFNWSLLSIIKWAA